MKIALTFDIERDIPNFLNTYFGIKNGLMRILDLLDEFSIKGTFFCTGKVVEDLPNYILLIEQRGHEVGCHSLNHGRLSQLTLEECRELIYQNKKLVEKLCNKSEIIGFRAPYLSPPKFLFEVLNKLKFKYDSSIDSPAKLHQYQINGNQIQEFHPSNYSIFFRLPYPFLKRKLFKKDLLILYFHAWEAINMKKLIFKQAKFDAFKNILFRPDRWFNTGNSFMKILRNFVIESLTKKAEFITLKQLC